jgi:hypothetical protein
VVHLGPPIEKDAMAGQIRQSKEAVKISAKIKGTTKELQQDNEKKLSKKMQLQWAVDSALRG